MIERIYGYKTHRYKFRAIISKLCLYLTYRSLFDCDPSNSFLIKNNLKDSKSLKLSFGAHWALWFPPIQTIVIKVLSTKLTSRKDPE